jgi:two-component system, NarL family, sensor kinase
MTKEDRLSEVKILKEIAELLNEGTDMKSVLPEVLKKLLEVTNLETGWIFLIDGEGKYNLAAKEQLPRALSLNHYAPMCQGGCWCVDRFNNGKLNKATNIIGCKRIEDAIEEGRGDTNGLTHHASVPLRAGDERFGILNIGSPHKTRFTDGELALLESVAFQIGTALKRIALTQREQELALTAERNRLARDLHDSVNQLLFSVNLTARGGMEMAEEAEVKETFSYIQDLAQEALSEMRALIWQLRPRGLENGLVSALKNYGQMLGLQVEAEVKGVIALPGKIEEALWRMGQEAFGNCKKHSGQGLVRLFVKADSSRITMIIKDEGCGFYYDKEKGLPSMGLNSMKARTEMLKGSFSIKTAPGQGTEIQINIPI